MGKYVERITKANKTLTKNNEELVKENSEHVKTIDNLRSEIRLLKHENRLLERQKCRKNKACEKLGAMMSIYVLPYLNNQEGKS